MLKANSDSISIEQACVWRETGTWVDHEKAAFLGFADEALSHVLSKHESGRLHLSGNVDGDRKNLDRLVGRDFRFAVTWRRLAGTFLADSRGTCAVRGISYNRFRGETLKNLNCPADGDTRSIEGKMVQGFHCVITDILLNQHEAVLALTWAPSEPDSCNATGPISTQAEVAHQEFFLKQDFLGITICAREQNLSARGYMTPQPKGPPKRQKRRFANAIRPAWDRYAKTDSRKHAGRRIFSEIKTGLDEDRFAARCGAILAELEKCGWSDFPTVPDHLKQPQAQGTGSG
jgi:hypothetical protein